MISVFQAITRRPWATALLLIGLPVSLFLALGPAAEATAVEESTTAANDVAEVAPDMVLQLTDSDDFDARFAQLSSAVADLAGVSWVSSDQTAAPTPNLLIGFAAGSEDVGLRSLERFVAEQPDAADMRIGGRAAIDDVIGDRLAGRSLLVVTLAAVVAAALVAWLIRSYQGIVVGVTVALSGWLGGTLGAKAAGPFDGSLVTTLIPAVLVALVISTFLCFRLLAWFEEPVGDDLAEMIRRSVLDLGIELVLFFAAFIVADLFLELVGPGRSIATVILVGALTATLITLAVVPPALAGLHGAGIPAVPVEADDDHPRSKFRSFLANRPNGRHFPIGVILAFAFFFGFLGLLALSTTTRPALLDGDDLAGGAGTTAFAERLQAGGGDPTGSILAVFPDGVDQLAKTAWLQRVSQLPTVGRVDTSLGRFVGGDELDLESPPLGSFAAGADGDETPGFALIVPTASARSDAAQQLVDAVRATNAPVNAELSGPSVDSWTAAQRDRSLVWVTIIALALVGGVATFGLVGDLALAGMTAGLRLLGSMALVGLYHLVADAVSGSELLLVVFVTSVGAGLFELGFLRRLTTERDHEDTEGMVNDALNREGWAAAVALCITALASLGFIGTGLGVLTRLGIVMALGVGVEVVVGLWLLRPAVLGTRAIAHLAAQPVGRALQRLTGAAVPDDAELERWTGVVDGLLRAEFEFQADPGIANMETVFVGDTPLFRKAVEHHQNLAGASLRIIGRTPQLRTVQVVSTSPQATVAVTIDHPVRQLVDQAGKVVGVRKAERRTVMLWLSEAPDGTHRIADSVELGAVPLGTIAEPASTFAPATPAAVE